MSRWAEHYFGSFGSSLCCVAGEIVRPEIRFGFDDATDTRAILVLAHEIFSEQLLGDIDS
jgi:hypothetical protein